MVSHAAERMRGRHATAPKVHRGPAPYDGFDLLPIRGEWRRGGAGHQPVERNPYTREILLETPQGDGGDLDRACAGAMKAQQADQSA
jgi:hypothetical protein